MFMYDDRTVFNREGEWAIVPDGEILDLIDVRTMINTIFVVF